MREALILRADASPTVGAGHLMRLLALADAYRASGGRTCIAVSADAGSIARLAHHRGHTIVEVCADAGTPHDAEEVIDLARVAGAETCVVDGYRFPDDYYEQLGDSGLTVVAIDDLSRELSVDLLVDPNYGATCGDLRGPDYAMLRPEFSAHPRAPRHRPRGRTPLRLLISFGGSDPTRSAARVLRNLPEGALIVATVVTGPAYRDDGELDEAVAVATAAGHAVELPYAVGDMAAVMAHTDAAVCAAGSVLWELAYFGCPTAAFVVAGNQHAAGSALARDRYVLSGEWLLDLSDDRLHEHMSALMGDGVLRMRLGRKLAGLVDGRGANRVLGGLREACARRREAA